MDDGEKMFGGAEGGDRLEPVEAFPFSGVEGGERGLAGADSVAGAMNFLAGGRQGAGHGGGARCRTLSCWHSDLGGKGHAT